MTRIAGRGGWRGVCARSSLRALVLTTRIQIRVRQLLLHYTTRIVRGHLDVEDSERRAGGGEGLRGGGAAGGE